ncbi:MAG: cytochrome c biogenesis protein CcsA [Deltaproteobacteria bacterium]|nr:cytochrome c biogenesis protein CcsA [Deltaproteobacteria bacterium]
MKAGLFIATAILYAIACILYLFLLTRGSDKAQRVPGTVFVAALGAHLAFLLLETPSPGELPLADISQILSVSSFGIGIAFLVASYRFDVTMLGAFVVPLSLMLFLASGLGSSYAPVSPGVVSPGVQSLMLTLHIGANVVGLIAFALAFAAGVAYMLQERLLRRRQLSGAFQRLPSLDVLDTMGLRVGFPLLTFGMITGTFWLLRSEGSEFYVSQALGLVAWAIFASVIVLRVAAGWQGRKAAIGTMMGFLFTLLVLAGYALRAAGGPT